MKTITVLHQSNGQRDWKEGQDPVKDTKGIEYFHYARVSEEEMIILRRRIPEEVQKLLNNL